MTKLTQWDKHGKPNAWYHSFFYHKIIALLCQCSVQLVRVDINSFPTKPFDTET